VRRLPPFAARPADLRGLSMPPSRPTPPPPTGTGKARRRNGPVMPGSWIWVVMLLFLVGIFALNTVGTTATLSYSDFLRIVDNEAYSKNLAKVYFLGAEKIVGELRDRDKEKLPEESRLPKEIEEKLRTNRKFVTLKPPVEDPKLMEELRKRAEDKTYPLEIIREEDHFSWVGPLLM